jgi:hypothetical protein
VNRRWQGNFGAESTVGHQVFGQITQVTDLAELAVAL